MEIQRRNGTLSINGLRELSAVNARSFRTGVMAGLAPELKAIDIDLSNAGLVDSCGLGALVSLYKATNDCNPSGSITVRLLHPQPPVQQLFELTRMHHLFEIVPVNHDSANTPVAKPVLKSSSSR
jgi:anti-sigma B factor antagonist